MFGIDDLVIASLAGAGLSYAGSAKAASSTSSSPPRPPSTGQKTTAPATVNQNRTISPRNSPKITPSVLDANAINQQNATTQGDTSDDYDWQKHRLDDKTLEEMGRVAELMACIHSAKELRLAEQWRNQVMASEVGTAQNAAKIQNTIDNYRIQQAAQSGNGLSAAGNILGLAGTTIGITGALNGLASKAATQGITTATGPAANATGNAVLQKTATHSPAMLDQHATLGILGNLY